MKKIRSSKMTNIVRHPAPTKFLKCPFCGRFPLTKTHIFPKWLTRIIPADNSFTSHAYQPSGWISVPVDPGDEKARRTRTTQHHSRDFFTQQPYIACNDCNKGWMKTLEDSARSFVKPLITDEKSGTIDELQKSALASWFGLMTIVSELHSYTKKTISTQDIEYLKVKGCLPDNWTMFGAHLNGHLWRKRCGYHNMGVFPSSRGISSYFEQDGLPAYNTQITTIGIGHLLVQVFTCPEKGLCDLYRNRYLLKGFTPLWPDLGGNTRFPFAHSLNDVSAEAFANDFFANSAQIIESANRIF